MTESSASEHEEPNSSARRLRLNLSWLLKLRWAALALQVAALLGVSVGLRIELPVAALAVPWCVLAVTNAVGAWAVRHQRGLTEATLGGLMLLDVALLTVVLYLTGGPHNPFTILYLANIVLAAVTLKPVWSWSLALMSIVCYGGLFVRYTPLSAIEMGHGHHAHGGGAGSLAGMESMASGAALHVQGMFVAFAVTALLIALIITRVTRALGALEAEIADARQAKARADRIEGLAALAAGAAHELATPLSTVAVVVRELERALERGEGSKAEWMEDLGVVRGELARCRAILDRMAYKAGQGAGEQWRSVTVAELIEASLQGLPDREAVSIALPEAVGALALRMPAQALQQALRAVIHNALEVTPPGGSVRLSGAHTRDTLTLTFRDDGPGMPPEVLARVGEPFFTTKEVGQGTGLGIFLTRAVIERVGGTLTFDSTPGQGTRVVVTLPAQRDGVIAEM